MSMPDTLLPRLARRLFLGFALLCGLAGAAHAAADVTGVRFGRHGTETRLVLDMSDSPAFRIESDDARRFVLELPALASASLPPATGPHGVVGRIAASRSADSSRIAIETTGAARINRAFYLPAGDGKGPRLVIDFAADPAAPGGQVYGSRPKSAAPVFTPTSAVADAGVLMPPSKPAAPEPGEAPLPGLAPQVLAATAAAPAGLVPLPPSKPALAAGASSVSIPTASAMAVPAAPAPAPARLPIIVIDAGHGGVDPGATAVTGIQEKMLTLAVARELRRQLMLTGRYRVVLTRDRDLLVPLRGRVQRAQEARGDLFISLHADSIGRGQVRGLSIYTLSDTASDAETAALARRENRDTVINGVTLSDERADVANILIDLAMRDSVNQSNRLANTLLKALDEKDIRLLEQNPHRAAGFVVLKAVNMPSVLVEMGYLSHDGEARQLSDPAHQKRLAGALVTGIDGYFSRRGTQVANR